MDKMQLVQGHRAQQRVICRGKGMVEVLHTHMLSKSCLYCSSPRPPSTSLSSLRRISSSNCKDTEVSASQEPRMC